MPPELPEVETTLRGIQAHITQQIITRVIIRNRALRWPITHGLASKLTGQTILHVQRRAKYLIIDTTQGHILIHLGMSGNLRLVPHTTPAGKHDHIDFVLQSGYNLRLNDPRRFGTVQWIKNFPEQHPLLKTLGPEPLSDIFTADYLWHKSRQRKVAIKNFIMNSHIVVGVGNIYASESLFLAGIAPTVAAGNLSLAHYQQLTMAIQTVLTEAITHGGTTLRDFLQADGKPGYFRHALQVYGRENQPCYRCQTPIQHIVIGQRATYFCTRCQSL